ncbi:hypothetical protein GCM10022198_07900 [Klugiella xanthotipulae]|uniref:Uncharacterized protein n=1 Tax=Klugiella xanthotipulae TaxID=244735 RepID=A0A543HT36_9MICO|nr:hypothetical protein [Klugiella xanthotipulae]TQM61450.1 hypothetical protein FB466_2404 [Klugiella xanthotipulae]
MTTIHTPPPAVLDEILSLFPGVSLRPLRTGSYRVTTLSGQLAGYIHPILDKTGTCFRATLHRPGTAECVDLGDFSRLTDTVESFYRTLHERYGAAQRTP